VPTLKNVILILLLGISAFPGMAQEDPRLLMLHARAKQRRAGGEDPEGAAAMYRKVIAQVPNSAEAYLRLSEALVESEDLAGAVAPATRATELDPRSAEAWIHLGFLQFLRGQTIETARADSRRALEEASRLLPGDAEVILRLAQICQVLDDSAGALKAWLRLGRLHPMGTFQDRPLGLLAWERAATLAANLNQYEAKREAVMALCRGNRPEAIHLRMLEELAREQAEKGYLGHAEESFLLMAQHVPEEPGLWENIARIQIQTERFEAALQSLEKAEAIKKTSRILYFKAISFMNLGRLPEADALWRDFFNSPEQDKELSQGAAFCFGVCLLMEGRPAQLLDSLKSWPETEPKGDQLALKAQALIQIQSWKAAKNALKAGVAQFPKQALFARALRTIPSGGLEDGFWSGRGSRQLLIQLNLETMAALWAEFRQWDKCLELILQARKASSHQSLDLLLLHANALDQLDRPAEAMGIYREAQKLKPDDALLQNNLGYLILEKGGDLEEAAHLIETSLQQDPKNGSTMDSWGWVLFKQGKFKEAEETLEKAVELRPYNAEIRRHLGEVLLKLDRQEEALEQWERALAFAFPDRKELEERARQLRVDLAKQQQSADSTGAAPDDDEDSNEGAEDY
jgi:tetratricopeptide (TPR) repeat protein